MIIGFIYFPLLIVLAVCGYVAVKHAARFRYLSARTVIITLIFIALSISIAAIATYLFFAVDWTDGL